MREHRSFSRPFFTVILGLFTVSIVLADKAFAQQAKPEAKAASAVASPEEAAVRALLRSLISAYNAADLGGLGALFTENAILMDTEGEETAGKPAIIEHYKAAFGDGSPAKIKGATDSIRLLTPDVASASGSFDVSDEQVGTLSVGRFSLLAVKKEGKWLVAELRDHSVEAAESTSNYENLQDLEWLVGDWVDEGQQATIASSVKWAENKNFLVRTYRISIEGEPTTTGTQWIGWDAQAALVRSWVFDSQGGFGESTWSRDGNRWILKATGVIRDGSSTSSTQIIEPINNDSVRLSSVDRTVDGELVPPGADVIMVRKPPAPTSAEAVKPAQAEKK